MYAMYQYVNDRLTENNHALLSCLFPTFTTTFYA